MPKQDSTAAKRFQDARTFMEIVTGKPDAIADFRTVPEAPGCKELPRNHRGRVSEMLPVLAKRNAAGCGVFYLGSRSDGEGRKKANMKAARIVPLDLDGAPLPESFELEPHAVIETSPGKFHAIWAIDESSDFAFHRDIVKRMAAEYGGDPSVSDVTRILRLPGFAHMKTGKPFTSRLVKHADPAEVAALRYDLSEFGRHLPPLPAPEPGDDGDSAPSEGELTPELAERILEQLDPNAFAVTADGGDVAWRNLAMALHDGCNGDSDVLEAFKDFCARDPEYATDEQQTEIENRWNSFSSKREGKRVTLGSLIRLCEQHGVESKLVDRLKFGKQSAADDFDDGIPFAPVDVFEGTEFEFDAEPEFDRNADGRIVAGSQHNVRLAIDSLGASVSYDEFADKIRIEGLKGFGPYLDDAALDRLWLKVDARFHFRPEKSFFTTVILDYARRRSFHPVREYLDEAQAAWDGKARLDRLLIEYGGAKDTPFNRAASALPLIAAVRRIRHPGAKFDEMAVLESAQGKNKSSALEVLAIRKEWFTDSLPLNADDKRTIEAVTGKLIVECADLHGLGKADVDHVKAQLSRQVDRARLAYGRLTTERPRQFIIYGTANADNYLRDRTGNRRFWPVKVDRFDLDRLRADLQQLWGEAAFREAFGDATRLDPSLYAAATAVQTARTDAKSDPFTDTLANVLGDAAGKITSEDVWQILGMTTPGLRTQVINDRMGAAMRYLGWRRTQFRADGKKQKGYVKGPQPWHRLYVDGTAPRCYVSHDVLEPEEA